jgi:hypothetical protein
MSHHYSGPQFGFPNGDALLDFCDLYAFPKPDDVGKSIVIVNVHPSSSLSVDFSSNLNPQSRRFRFPSLLTRSTS